MASRETQDRIIESAIALFNERGSEAVSTNHIAVASGVSKGNLHYHFRNKREIIQCIYGKIVDEMNASWYGDHLHPTLRHMAEMFARQALLIYEYRFFYREMPGLLRSDPLLMQRYRENWNRRVPALEEFFCELDQRGELNLNGDRTRIRSLVHSTWIIADNWLNSMEFLGLETMDNAIIDGYSLILTILQPYLSFGTKTHIVGESKIAIQSHVQARSSRRPSAIRRESLRRNAVSQ